MRLDGNKEQPDFDSGHSVGNYLRNSCNDRHCVSTIAHYENIDIYNLPEPAKGKGLTK